jgi:hypothetical protein
MEVKLIWSVLSSFVELVLHGRTDVPINLTGTGCIGHVAVRVLGIKALGLKQSCGVKYRRERPTSASCAPSHSVSASTISTAKPIDRYDDPGDAVPRDGSHQALPHM